MSTSGREGPREGGVQDALCWVLGEWAVRSSRNDLGLPVGVTGLNPAFGKWLRQNF